MSKKDYERAAALIQERADHFGPWHDDFVQMFVEFFAGDNVRFDADRFRAACTPGANVKARGKRSAA